MATLAIKAKGGATPRIVPSKLTVAKKGKTKKRSPVKPTKSLPMAVDRECIGLPEGMTDGFPYRWDGEWIVVDDFPKTGGPWIPAIQPNGSIVWINGANL